MMKNTMSLPAPPVLRVLTPLIVSFAGFQAAADAATVGHWRFENASSLGEDSSGNGLTLANTNGAVSVATASGFPNPVPQTGAANSLAADFELDSSQYLSTTDNSLFAFQSFTIEAYIRLESLGSSTVLRPIASQLATSGNNQAWQFGITGSGSTLGASVPFLQLSQNGNALVSFSMNAAAYKLTAGLDYYVAATVDFRADGVDVTLYFQDLTAGGDLLSLTQSSNAITGLFDSTANFAIGASFTTANVRFDGVIDEVRLSDVALSQAELLNVPEPASSALALLGAGFLIRRRR